MTTLKSGPQIIAGTCSIIAPAFAISHILSLACDTKSQNAIEKIDLSKIKETHQEDEKREIGIVNFSYFDIAREGEGYQFATIQAALSLIANLGDTLHQNLLRQIMMNNKLLVCLTPVPIKHQGSDDSPGYLVIGQNFTDDKFDSEEGYPISIRIHHTKKATVLSGHSYMPIVYKI